MFVFGCVFFYLDAYEFPSFVAFCFGWGHAFEDLVYVGTLL